MVVFYLEYLEAMIDVFPHSNILSKFLSLLEFFCPKYIRQWIIDLVEDWLDRLCENIINNQSSVVLWKKM